MKIKCNCENKPTEIEFIGDERAGYKGVCDSCLHSFGFKNIVPQTVYNPFKSSRKFRRSPK